MSAKAPGRTRIPKALGGNPGVIGGTKGAEGGTEGAEAQTPSVTRVRRGLLTNWAIADRERVGIGLRQGKRGRVLVGAVVAKADNSEENGREQRLQQGCQ